MFPNRRPRSDAGVKRVTHQNAHVQAYLNGAPKKGNERQSELTEYWFQLVDKTGSPKEAILDALEAHKTMHSEGWTPLTPIRVENDLYSMVVQMRGLIHQILNGELGPVPGSGSPQFEQPGYDERFNPAAFHDEMAGLQSDFQNLDNLFGTPMIFDED